MRASRRRWTLVERAFMDGGHAGDRVAGATAIRVEIVRKPKGEIGFALHARCWVVEGLFPWIGRNRSTSASTGKDFEATIASANALLNPPP